MNIPEKIRVLHQTYRVSEVDNLHDGADDLYDQVRYLEERILLNSGASDEASEDQVSRCQRFMITSRVCIDMLDKFELKEIAINQNIA